MSAHQAVNLPGAPEPRGYSDAMIPTAGRLVVLGGHVSFDSERRLVHPGQLVGQLRQTLRNLCATLAEAGARPEHLVKLTIHTTDVPRYREALKELGQVWREVLGPVYPAMTLLGVSGLFDEGAVLEIDGLAIIPDDA
jgi:enamine deaminase RidA (YjgF/YER057c/UK114 family)